MTSNNAIIDDLIRREGGFANHPADRGGPTNHGITWRTLTRWLKREPTIDEMKSLTTETAHAIYRSFYVVTPRFDRIEDEDLRAQVIDAGVLHGTGWAARRLQECVGVAADGIIGPISVRAINFHGKTNGLGARFLRRRIHRIGRIVQEDSSQLVWLTGWLDRAASFA